MDDLLNPYQRDAIEAVLQEFEASLREGLRWLDGAGEDGILYKKSLELPVEQMAAAREKIALALDEIRILVNNLALEVAIENASTDLRAKMILNWVHISGRHSYELKGFGQVNPELAGVIDQHIDNLAQIALDLSLLFT